MTSHFSKFVIYGAALRFILLFFIVGISLGRPSVLVAQDNICRTSPDDERPPGPKPKMVRYVIQEIYLGMSFKELKLIKPEVLVRRVREGTVVREYVAELLVVRALLLFLCVFCVCVC